jgi:hypothetical protein
MNIKHVEDATKTSIRYAELGEYIEYQEVKPDPFARSTALRHAQKVGRVGNSVRQQEYHHYPTSHMLLSMCGALVQIVGFPIKLVWYICQSLAVEPRGTTPTQNNSVSGDSVRVDVTVTVNNKTYRA